MRTLIDLTEDDSPGGGPSMPNPCSIGSEGDDIIISLRETELRMTFGQFCEYREALDRFAFQTYRAWAGRADVEISDEDYCGAAEHEALRKLVCDVLDDAFDGVDVPAALRDRIRWRLSKDTNNERWRSQDELITELRGHVQELTTELGRVRAGKRQPPK